MRQSIGIVLALALAVGACGSDVSTAPTENQSTTTPIPQFSPQQLGILAARHKGVGRASLSVESECECGAWSCQENICGNDPAIYGACCVACAYDTGSVVARPSCTGSPVGQPECNSSTWGSCEVEHPDYFCPAPCACCYFRDIA